jgi:hypothetical protein
MGLFHLFSRTKVVSGIPRLPINPKPVKADEETWHRITSIILPSITVCEREVNLADTSPSAKKRASATMANAHSRCIVKN